MNTEEERCDQAFLINHRFIQVFPQTDYEMESDQHTIMCPGSEKALHV